MAAISKKLRNWVNPANGEEGLTYWCQGCKDWHTIRTKGAGAWGWNGDVDRPTFTPSVLVTSGHFAPHYSAESDTCWCTYNAEQLAKGEKPARFACQRCHTFITDGRVQFLGDCTHGLAGQTLDLPDLPAEDAE
jgi:hypothetical protein